jgi:hypothetical protein
MEAAQILLFISEGCLSPPYGSIVQALLGSHSESTNGSKPSTAVLIGSNIDALSLFLLFQRSLDTHGGNTRQVMRTLAEPEPLPFRREAFGAGSSSSAM